MSVGTSKARGMKPSKSPGSAQLCPGPPKRVSKTPRQPQAHRVFIEIFPSARRRADFSLLRFTGRERVDRWILLLLREGRPRRLRPEEQVIKDVDRIA